MPLESSRLDLDNACMEFCRSKRHVWIAKPCNEQGCEQEFAANTVIPTLGLGDGLVMSSSCSMGVERQWSIT